MLIVIVVSGVILLLLIKKRRKMKFKQNRPPKASNTGFKGRKSGKFSNECEDFGMFGLGQPSNPMYHVDDEALPQLRYGTHKQYCP